MNKHLKTLKTIFSQICLEDLKGNNALITEPQLAAAIEAIKGLEQPKETWTEFFRRVNPKNEEQFKDRNGNVWEYSFISNSFSAKNTNAVVYVDKKQSGTLLECPLLDPEPKLIRLELHGWFDGQCLRWAYTADCNWKPSLDENGKQWTKIVWVRE